MNYHCLSMLYQKTSVSNNIKEKAQSLKKPSSSTLATTYDKNKILSHFLPLISTRVKAKVPFSKPSIKAGSVMPYSLFIIQECATYHKE